MKRMDSAVREATGAIIERCHTAVLLIQFRRQDGDGIAAYFDNLMSNIRDLEAYLELCDCEDPIPAMIRDIRKNRNKLAAALPDDCREIMFRLLDNIEPVLVDIKNHFVETG